MCSRLPGATLVVALSLLAACSCPPRIARPRPSAPHQVVAIAGPTLGSGEIRPTDCTSGQHRMFFGADLAADPRGLVLRVIIDPLDGPVVRVFKASDPYGASIVARRRDCKTLNLRFLPTGSSLNFVNEMKLSLEVDCETLAHDFIVGEVSAEACG